MITHRDATLPSGWKTALEKLFKAIFMPVRAEMNDGDVELGMLKSLIPDGSTTIDVGANVGDFSRRLAQLSGNGLVLAFEPQALPRNVHSMAGYFRKPANTIVFPFALGDPSQTTNDRLVELKVPIKGNRNIGVGLAHIGNEEDLATRFVIKRELVALFSLDEVMARIDCAPVSLIKIDVEGGELDVLRGGLETLKTYRPAILCEIDNREGRFGIGKDELNGFLQALDYVPRRISDLSELPWDALEKNTVFTPINMAGVVPASSSK